MAPLLSTAPDQTQERRLLAQLLAMYAEQKRVYARVLALSQRQGEILAQQGSLAEIRQILGDKKVCLDTIRQLERTSKASKVQWENGRSSWSASARSRLHQALREVSTVIEEILMHEERNDKALIEAARTT